MPETRTDPATPGTSTPATRPQAAPAEKPRISGSADDLQADRILANYRNPSTMPTDAELLAAYVVKGAAQIEKGARNPTDWARQMVAQYGEPIRPQLDNILHKSLEYLQQQALATPQPGESVATPSAADLHQRAKAAGVQLTPQMEEGLSSGNPKVTAAVEHLISAQEETAVSTKGTLSDSMSAGKPDTLPAKANPDPTAPKAGTAEPPTSAATAQSSPEASPDKAAPVVPGTPPEGRTPTSADRHVYDNDGKLVPADTFQPAPATTPKAERSARIGKLISNAVKDGGIGQRFAELIGGNWDGFVKAYQDHQRANGKSPLHIDPDEKRILRF